MTTPHPSTDYAKLRREGIHHLERMASRAWTDFNAHDPGITILEQLCYAITDLGYRTFFDIPDLLAEGGDDGAGRLYRPSQVLTCHPVTLTDLRKLAMDVDGVKNAWIELVEQQDVPLHFHPGKTRLSLTEEPPASEPVYLKGLYRVLIETSDLAGIDREKVRREVAAQLHANRGLCEDFQEIRVLDGQGIRVNARVEIGQVEDVDDVLLSIFERLSDYLSPRVPFRTLQQMLEDNRSIDEIFEGPALRHGFLETAALNSLHRRVAVHGSDLIREIMSIDGVRAVRSLTMGSGSTESDWVIAVGSKDAPTAPVLDLANTSIALQRDRLEIRPDLARVIRAYNERRRLAELYGELPESERDVIPPRGRDRKLSQYRSVQHQFPLVYGIGAAGVPTSASRVRRAHARQLKAYVMFFDQLLANLFAQLAHAKDLLSFHGQGSRTYFSHMIDDPELDLESIRTRDADSHSERLQDITETSVQSARIGDRRNRFLTHLLARFAEHFTDYSLLLHGAVSTERATPAEKLIQDKRAFLGRFPRISAGRGTASDYSQPVGPDNVSGLEERIRLKLGLPDAGDESFVLVEHILLRAVAADSGQNEPFLEASRSRDPYSLQLSLVFPNWPARFKDDGFRALVEQTVREETPAHLMPYVHWLGRRQMTEFRETHKRWLTDLRRARPT